MTDDPKSSPEKKPILEVKLASAPLCGLTGLCVVPSQIRRAIETGRVEYGSRGTHYTVAYQDHPWEFVIHLGLYILLIPLCAGMIYQYFFGKQPD